MKEIFFPRGGTQSKEFKRESIWRETSFMLELLRQAVGPNLSLSDCIHNWKNIKSVLAEERRKRKLQLKNIPI